MAIKISGTTVIPDTLGSANQVLRINSGGTEGEWADSSGGIDYVYKTANYTANANEGVITDTTGGAFTVTLPASPSVGDLVVINDAEGNWDTANLTVARNGSTIDGDASDMTMDVDNASVDFIYDGTTWGVYSQAGFVTTSATYASTEFTATASQTTFAVAYTAGLVDVYLNGVKLAAADFTATNGISVVLAAGAAVNDIVEVVAWASYDVANVATAGQGALADSAVQPGDSLDAGDLINALPAINGAALTSLNSASLSGALPAIDGSALTGLPVGAVTAGLAAGAVGTYAFLVRNGTAVYFGTNYAGSELVESAVSVVQSLTTFNTRYSANATGVARGSATVAGTWKCMGEYNADSTSTYGRATLFLRIS
jgi:hypothetical protein